MGIRCVCPGGLAASENTDQLRALGLRAGAYFVLTSVVAIILGLSVAIVLAPGALLLPRPKRTTMSKNKHVYALFETPAAALAAYAAVQEGGCSGTSCSMIIHEEHIDESALTSDQRGTREGARGGAAVGGAAGVVITGLAVLGGGLMGVGPLAMIAFGGGVMAAYGGVLGGMVSSDGPRRSLEALREQIEHGKTLIAVETDDSGLETMCTRVFELHGAAVSSDSTIGARVGAPPYSPKTS